MQDWIALNMTPGWGRRPRRKLLERFGSAEGMFGALWAELERLRLRPETVVNLTPKSGEPDKTLLSFPDNRYTGGTMKERKQIDERVQGRRGASCNRAGADDLGRGTEFRPLAVDDVAVGQSSKR